MEMKGFAFTLDALLAVMIAAVILTATYSMLPHGQQDYYTKSQLVEYANDILIVLDKNGTLETLDRVIINRTLSAVVPENFAALLDIRIYECKDAECNEFEKIDEIIAGTLPSIDIILVMDVSGSMSDDGWDSKIRDYQPIGDAKIAAKSFVDMLTPSNDRSGLVSYSTDAELEHNLTFSQSDVKDAITDLSAGGFTAMDKGIAEANAELITHGRTNVPWVQLLMSDGLNNCGDFWCYWRQTRGQSCPECEESLRDATQEAADNEIKIYTIGLGENINSTVMREVADMTDGEYYYAPTSKELKEIYTGLLKEILTSELDYVRAERDFVTFENNRIKYFCLTELRMWLR